MKKVFIMTMTCVIVLFFNSMIYADDNYKFDPNDSHHSLYIPDGSGPFPAILLLHASTGVVPINHDWAVFLKNHGYVVYLIDSFKPRGWKDRESVGWEKATTAQLADVAPAYNYLRQLHYVDASRIGVLGFSMGGFDVLRIMEANPPVPADFQKISFKAAASFYGVCHRLSLNTQIKGSTTLFIGSEDDRATTNDCKDLVKVSSRANKNVAIKIYQNALHGFDNFEFPPSKEIIDERGEHYHIGYNAQARQLAIKDLQEYFDQMLK